MRGTILSSIRRPLAAVSTLLLIALVVASCAGDGESPPTTTPRGDASPTIARPAASPTPPPGDGSGDALNPGSTEPVTTKAGPNPRLVEPVLRDVRMASHPEAGGWDRIVFEFEGALPATRIEYVAQAIGCGTGLPIAVPGTVLQVRFDFAYAHDRDGNLTVKGTTLPGPGAAILQARLTCDYEAEVTWAVSVDGRQRFKATTLTNPPRVVIDVKQ